MQYNLLWAVYPSIIIDATPILDFRSPWLSNLCSVHCIGSLGSFVMGTMANGISKCSGRYFQFPGELPTGLLKVLAERCFVVVNVNTNNSCSSTCKGKSKETHTITWTHTQMSTQYEYLKGKRWLLAIIDNHQVISIWTNGKESIWSVCTMPYITQWPLTIDLYNRSTSHLQNRSTSSKASQLFSKIRQIFITSKERIRTINRASLSSTVISKRN